MRLTGTRHERWRVDLLDAEDQFIRPLHEFVGGSYEVNANRAIWGGGSIDVVLGEDSDDIDWGQHRFKVWYSPGFEGGERVWWPRGVFLVGLPDIEYDDETGLREGSVKIMDKNLVLDQDSDPGSFSVLAGDYVTDVVRHLILSAGEVNLSVEEAFETVKTATVWEPGTSKLQIINDLLATINYRLRLDGNGQFRVEPITPAAHRGIAWEFTQGRDSLHIPRWSKEDDWADTPNRVVMISQGDEETEALMSVAENTNPESRFSYQGRGGRWIVHTETDVEVTSQEVLDNLAAMRLGGLATTYSNMSVEHAMLDLWPEDRVALSTEAYETTAEVRSFSVGMRPGSLVSGSWREVFDV